MSNKELVLLMDRDEAEVAELVAEAKTLNKPGKKKGFMALLNSSRGSGTIEKVFMIAVFIFVAAIGLTKLGKATKKALEKQAKTIEKLGK